MIKVLHVSLSLDNDGHISRLLAECEGLRALGHNVSLITRDAGGRIPTDFEMLKALRACDVVHTHDVEGMNLVGVLLKSIPMSAVFVAGIHYNSGYGAGMIRIPDRVDAVVCVSKHDAESMRWSSPGIASKVYCIYTGLETALYGGPLNPPPARKRVGCYATGRRKGADLFIEAARAFPYMDFHLVGGLGDLPSMEIPENLKIFNRMTPVEFRGWLKTLSIYVQPSREESLGVALLEAGASAVPCVGSTAGGIPEALLGFSMENGSLTSLVTAIDAYHACEDLSLRMGLAMRRKVRAKFGVSRMVDKTEELYKKLIGGDA